MKALLQLISVCLLVAGLTVNLDAQKYTLEGIITSEKGEALEAASIVVLQQQDSILSGFGISDDKGRFRILDVEAGSYIVQFSFLGFEDFSLNMEVAGEEKKIMIPVISMQEADSKLEEVTIKAYQIPVRMKQDTIEYNALAFKTAPNAAVEDLLKKMPGIEVDKEGQIKAQGETVNQVLVEGKEFFGQDPKIATKNLPADAVDKVQVFDKQSEMAEFSGIDDGQEAKTINLRLKEGHKDGQFGNGSFGYGTKDRFEGKFNVNRFNKKSQLSAIGMANNINEQGFSIMEYIDFMGGLSSMMSGGGGGIRISSDDLGVPLAFGGQQGFVRTYSGGLNLNHEFSKNTEFNASYFFSQIKNDIDRQQFRENLLTDNNFTTDEDSDNVSKSTGHTANFKFSSKIDSTEWITLRGNASYNDGFTSAVSESFIRNENNVLETERFTDTHSSGDRISFGLTGDYNKRIGKKSRIFSANFNISNRDDSNEAFLNSLNRFGLSMNGLFREDVVNQRQAFNNDQLNYLLRATYTEPLGNGKYISLSYGRQNYDNQLVKDFYDIVFSPEQSETLNEILSQNFDRTYTYDRFGLNYKLNRKKFNLNTGVQFQNSNLTGKVNGNGSDIDQSFRYFLPNLRLQLEFSGNRDLTLTYRTDIREPSLEQLQPLVDNTNPFSIYIGNPNLRPEYNHRLNLHYFSYSAFNDVSLFLTLDGLLTRDKIKNSQTIDAEFIQTTRPVNVARDYITSSYVSFATPFLGLKWNAQQESSFNRGTISINSAANQINRWNHYFDLSFENRNKDVLDWRIGANVRYNETNYSQNSNLNQDFSELTYYADVSVEIKNGWFAESSMDYKTYSNESFGSQTNLPIWKASLSKSFLKGQKGQLELTVYDILDKNLGISRTSSLNYLQETRVTSLSRYFMLTFSYNFAGFGAKKDGAIHIESNRRR